MSEQDIRAKTMDDDIPRVGAIPSKMPQLRGFKKNRTYALEALQIRPRIDDTTDDAALVSCSGSTPAASTAPPHEKRTCLSFADEEMIKVSYDERPSPRLSNLESGRHSPTPGESAMNNEVDCDELEESSQPIGLSATTNENEVDCDEVEESLRSVGAHRVRSVGFRTNGAKQFASSNVTNAVLQQEKQGITCPRFGRTSASATSVPNHHQSVSASNNDPWYTKSIKEATTLEPNDDNAHYVSYLDSASDDDEGQEKQNCTDAQGNEDDPLGQTSVEEQPQGGQVLGAATVLHELGYWDRAAVHRNLNDSDRDGLVEASPVYSDHFSRRGLAEPVGNSFRHKSPREAKEETYGIIACIVVAVACVLLTLTFGLKTNKDSNVVADNDTHTPSPTSLLPPMENLELLYQVLPDQTKERLYNRDSPQYQAWEWLLNHPDVPSYPEWRKKQVFAMATFFYSFEGPNWPEANPGHNRWLDVNISECSWVMSDREVAYFAQQSAIVLGDAYDLEDYQPCNEHGQLQTVILHQLYLPSVVVPVMPPEIGLLTSMRILCIVSSQIGGKLSDLFVQELIELPNLFFLAFQDVGVGGTIPTKIGLMTGLRTLVLGANDLTGTFPSEIARISSLEHLLLDNMNGITGMLPSELGHMTSLTGLEVARNSFCGLIPSELGLLSHTMWRLSLGGNMFSGSIPRSVWEFSHLDRLLLSDLPNLHGSIPEDVFMPNLTVLSFSGSPSLSGTIPEDICFIHEVNFDCSDSLCGCSCHCTGNFSGTNR